MDPKQQDWWERQRLVEELRALRRLPPGTQLNNPRFQIDRELFDNLLHLDDTRDPLLWLVHEQSELIARVLLWSALDRGRSLSEGLVARAQAERGPSVQSTPFSTELAQTHPTVATSDQLLAAVRAFRVFGLATQLPSFMDLLRGDEVAALLPDLLTLSDRDDVLTWLQRSHSQLASVQTLRMLLSETRPTSGLSAVGEVVSTRALNIKRRSEGMYVLRGELALMRTYFVLLIRTRIPRSWLQVPDVTPIGMNVGLESIDRRSFPGSRGHNRLFGPESHGSCRC